MRDFTKTLQDAVLEATIKYLRNAGVSEEELDSYLGIIPDSEIAALLSKLEDYVKDLIKDTAKSLADSVL